MISFASRFSSLAFLTAMVGLLGCGERSLPEEFRGSPVFFLEGQQDNQDKRLVAGEERYFMQTGFDQDNAEVYSFYGTLSPEGCLDCPGALRIEIRDEAQRQANEAIPIEQVLQPGSYDYQLDGAGKTEYKVRFQSSFVGNPPQSVFWDFGDGQTSGILNPEHTYSSDSLLQPLVCFQANDGSGCTTTICNLLNLDQADCSVDFDYTISGGSGILPYVLFQSRVSGQAPFRYRWDFGDGFGASLANPIYAFGVLDRYRVCLRVTDANGCSNVLCKEVATDPVDCAYNFSYAVTEQVANDPFKFSQVRISYVDADGEKLESQILPQPGWANFEILEIEKFEPNTQGNPTVKIRVRFSVLLTGGNRQMELRDWEGIFGLAYPQN